VNIDGAVIVSGVMVSLLVHIAISVNRRLHELSIDVARIKEHLKILDDSDR